MKPKILHIGCGPFTIDEYINTDMDMDITKPWPPNDNSMDAVVSQHVFQELVWRDLVYAFQEAYRVLKPGGYMRFGVPTVKTNMSLKKLLSWGNKTLLTPEVLYIVLATIGFKHIQSVEFKETNSDMNLTLPDNRQSETSFFEMQK